MGRELGQQLVGFVSAAARRDPPLRAFAPPGRPASTSSSLTGYQGQGYLNHEQAPNATCRVRSSRSEPRRAAAHPAAYAEPYQRQPVPETEVHVANAKLALSPTQGPVGTRAMLRGEGFPAGRTLQLVWQTLVGSRVSGNGFEPRKAHWQVTVGSDGQIDMPITIPEDLGGLHGARAARRRQDDRAGPFVIETSIVSISPASGPVGTPITIHLKGVGWTEYDNSTSPPTTTRTWDTSAASTARATWSINFNAPARRDAPHRPVSRHLSGTGDRAATALPPAAAHLCGRSSRQQDSGAAIHVRDHRTRALERAA